MALPSVTKTYTYNINNAVTAGASVDANFKDFWYNFKAALVAGGWTVRSSSNATTANTSDNWTSTASLTWSNGGARSWIVLRHPVCLWDLCIDLNSGGVSSANCTISISRGGFSTAGLVTNATPATTLGDGQTLATTAGQAWGATQQNFVWHYIRSTDGEVQRYIVCVADVPVWALFMDVPQSPASGWNPTTTPPGCVLYMNANAVSNAIGTTAYTGTPTVTRIGSSSGSAVPLYLAAMSYGGTLLVSGLQVPNDMTGEYPLVSLGYVSNTSPYRGQVATPYDMWFGVSNLLTGSTYPADNSRQFAQFGLIVLPWNGSVPLTR